MPKIRLLDQSVSEQIAAGEVIERPASVVKELVENAMDAGATAITVDLQGGGIGAIRITDNGCGISSEDAPMAFLRHATSKVVTLQDLENVCTMGFRGEALASIVAVAKVTMCTKTKDEPIGTYVRVEGGEFIEASETGCPDGTDLLVEQLFYNTPARLKFLKRDLSEGNAVTSYLEKLAISRPDIRFLHTKEGKTIFKTPGDGDLMACIWAIYGKDFAKTLVPVSAKEQGIEVSGFVSAPKAPRGNRTMQLFYVNGRVVRSKLLQAALEQAMHGHIMSGKFPACVLKLNLSPRLIDVNIHPTKLEVRFANEQDAFRSVYYGVQAALLAYEQKNSATIAPIKQPVSTTEVPQQITMPLKQQVFSPPSAKPATQPAAPSVGAADYVEKLRKSAAFGTQEGVKQDDFTDQKAPIQADSASIFASFEPPAQEEVAEIVAQPHKKPFEDIAPDPSLFSVKKSTPAPVTSVRAFEEPVETDATDTITNPTIQAPLEATDQPVAQSQPLDDFMVLGELHRTYILVQTPQGLTVIDKHAAHERILFEKWKDRLPDGQLLLTPLVLNCTASEFDALLSMTQLLEKWQFQLEEFGDRTLLVRQIPAILTPKKAKEALREMAGNWLSHRSDPASALEWVYHSVACRAAIKAGDYSTKEELEALTRQVLYDPNVRQCPHGRPVLFSLTLHEIEKRFGRLQ